jgi:hypothetical protein
MENKDLYELLIKVKDSFFKGHQITMLGKFEWLPVTERQAARYKKKTGKTLKFQFIKFKITKRFIDYTTNSVVANKPERLKHFQFYHLLISDLNPDDLTFYLLGDNCVGPLIGGKVRYKFKLDSIDDKMEVELLEKKMIAIR